MTAVVDACAHVTPASREDLLEYLDEPWRSRLFPGTEQYHYALRDGEYVAGVPATDPDKVRADLFDGFGLDSAVLLPPGRGLHPNVNLATALCAATNDWLADRFLGDERCYGTIRVDVRDPIAAVAEIERWAGDPRIVQVGVPTQSLTPYGDPALLPVWRAAAAHGLPVAIHTDGGSGADFPPSGAGYLQHAIEYECLASLNYAYHLSSLIAHGVFEWVEDLTVVFADGGFDLLWPLMWRLHKDWKGNRDEVPAAARPPAAYLRDHVRWVCHAGEGPTGLERRRRWLTGATWADELLVYGSNYPQRDLLVPAEARNWLPEPMHDAVLHGNARSIYRLQESKERR